MKSSMSKTTLREIRHSLGRYFAIMAIVALGVGLFSGLKATKSAMVKSAQHYFEENQLYDLRLLSTVGFDTDTAKQLSRREKVLDAQGALSTAAERWFSRCIPCWTSKTSRCSSPADCRSLRRSAWWMR